jgi:hypothetical protein
MRRLVLLALGLALACSMAGSASAVEIAFTLDDPPGSVPFAAGGATGFVNPFTGILDADFTICLGVCDIANEDWIVFTLSVTAGAVFDMGVASLGAGSASSIGYFTGVGGTPTALSLAVPTVPVFTFSGLTGTSVVLFVAYADGTLPADPNPPFDLPVGTTNFMITEDGGAGIQTVSAIITQQTGVIPEPSTALLLGSGLLLLGARARKRRR